MRPKIKSKEIQRELKETKALRPKNRRLNFTSKISWSDHVTIISKNLLNLHLKRQQSVIAYYTAFHSQDL